MVEPTANRLRESLQRFSGILSETEIRQIMAIQQSPLPTGVRINPLKANPQEAIQTLTHRYGWQVNPLPFCENAWTIETAEFPPGRTIEHRLGNYYLQDAASMVPVSAMEINDPHPLILDLAASPGGKTTHMIDRTQDQGFIFSNDASQSRIPALRSVLSTWGGINLAVTNFPGEGFGSWFPETFDLVLLDAPCSMENLRPTPSHPLRETTPAERMRLQDRQVDLLTSGLRALKISGQIVYATCSLAPEENEAVIDRVMKNHPHAFILEDITSKFPFNAPGLTAFSGETYDPTLAHSLRLWPHLTGMSGFFCARFQKVNPISSLPERPPSREFSRTYLELADQTLQTQVFEQIEANYGFDMWKIIEHYHLALFIRHDMFFLIPERYLNGFTTLPFEYIGMRLGKWIEDRLEPSHEFISRFGHNFTQGMIQIDDEQVTQWIAGRDIRYPNTDLSPKGQYLLVIDSSNRVLGMGKLLVKRLRNLLPRSSI